MYTLTLTEEELLFILVIYGVSDEEKFKEYGLGISETTSENLEKGEDLLRRRELITGDHKTPKMGDTVVALVGVTVMNSPENHIYKDKETGLEVRFVHEENMYLFKGNLDN